MPRKEIPRGGASIALDHISRVAGYFNGIIDKMSDRIRSYEFLKAKKRNEPLPALGISKGEQFDYHVFKADVYDIRDDEAYLRHASRSLGVPREELQRNEYRNVTGAEEKDAFLNEPRKWGTKRLLEESECAAKRGEPESVRRLFRNMESLSDAFLDFPNPGSKEKENRLFLSAYKNKVRERLKSAEDESNTGNMDMAHMYLHEAERDAEEIIRHQRNVNDIKPSYFDKILMSMKNRKWLFSENAIQKAVDRKAARTGNNPDLDSVWAYKVALKDIEKVRKKISKKVLFCEPEIYVGLPERKESCEEHEPEMFAEL